ncbi:hypothetical protein KP004_12710 [Geomonas oryzisoli]|uniref:Abortive phage resistance protein n=1 Tax=Geomonas oryzisoli TaxID=2847992 RepID=A0ABX8J4P6_9BACT|nr:abortive infection system antitoxin AbiGi family protein [Geomonas oryzisoli]QWV92081.1 hypothetical protein KP004_12710 [Geomonas oryzisoli]
MPLSANTLIHFTDEKENLKAILQENFRVFNCREEVNFTKGPVRYFVPMVSFCDIPLSEIKAHISKYGRYGIGLTKEWAVRNRLNPVLYIAKGSHLAESYRDAFIHYTARSKRRDGKLTDEQKSVADIVRYIKNYEADLTRKGTTIKNYRFSDEREWRYVPPFKIVYDMFVPQDQYEKEGQHFDDLLTDLRLTFEPNDIKYIIINDEDEIGEFIDHLRHTKGNKYSLHDIERLTTRILTSAQIEQDI